MATKLLIVNGPSFNKANSLYGKNKKRNVPNTISALAAATNGDIKDTFEITRLHIATITPDGSTDETQPKLDKILQTTKYEERKDVISITMEAGSLKNSSNLRLVWTDQTNIRSAVVCVSDVSNFGWSLIDFVNHTCVLLLCSIMAARVIKKQTTLIVGSLFRTQAEQNALSSVAHSNHTYGYGSDILGYITTDTDGKVKIVKLRQSDSESEYFSNGMNKLLLDAWKPDLNKTDVLEVVDIVTLGANRQHSTHFHVGFKRVEQVVLTKEASIAFHLAEFANVADL